MKRVHAIIRTTTAALVVAGLLVIPGESRCGDSAEVPLESAARRAISVGLGLDVNARTITLKGLVLATNEAKVDDSIEVELAIAPNVPARLRRAATAVRVLTRATVCVGKHCWRLLANGDEVAE